MYQEARKFVQAESQVEEAKEYQDWVASDSHYQAFEAGLVMAIREVTKEIKNKRGRRAPGLHSFAIPNSLPLPLAGEDEARTPLVQDTYRIIRGVLEGYSRDVIPSAFPRSEELIKWNDGVVPTETTYIRINEILGVAESVYRNREGEVEVRPEIWVGGRESITPEALEARALAAT